MGPEKRISNWKRALAGFWRIGRPAQRRANWQYLVVYWLLRKRLRLFSFRVLRTRHSLGARAHSARESTQIILLILRSVGGSFLFATLFVVAGGIIDFGFRRLITS
jgi:hypothetical protein